MYNYLNTKQEIKIVTMLCDDSYSIGDILKYIYLCIKYYNVNIIYLNNTKQQLLI